LNNTNNQLKLYIFYCSNSFNIDEFNQTSLEEEGDKQKIISLPCSGKVDLLYFLKAFETGADGIVLITCPINECHYLEGNLRAHKRAEYVNSILEEIGMGNKRITVLNMNENGMGDIIAKVKEFRNMIKGMASNSAGSNNAKTSVYSS
jgi:F420-non-reducing hydrogenase iron-sulfur subunit